MTAAMFPENRPRSLFCALPPAPIFPKTGRQLFFANCCGGGIYNLPVVRWGREDGRGTGIALCYYITFLITIKQQNMRVKNIFRVAAFAAVMAIAMPAMSQSNSAAINDDALPVPAATTTSTTDSRVEEMTKRLEEIKAMDKSNMTHADKKALRQEVRQMKKEAREARGVYISIGALIIIILLLILIL
jgi:hypothetical protein